MFKWLKSKFSKKKNEISPDQYFSIVKGKRNNITEESLKKLFDENKVLMDKMIRSGQVDAADRLLFHLKNIDREQAVIAAGYNQFVYRDDIEFLITEVSKNVVKLIDIESYEREIPNDVVDKVKEAKPMFDQLYVLYTDYTGKQERKIAKEDRVKDPIIFGAFFEKHKNINGRSSKIVWNHRFYYIADWVDEFCDLTLDKFVSLMNAHRRDAVHAAGSSFTLEELQSRLDDLKKQDDTNGPTKDN